MSDIFVERLKILSKNPSWAMELGKASEHMVCADIILNGYRCYLSDQGLPYDLVIDVDGRLIRVQVKASCFAREVNHRGKNSRLAYSFAVRRRGKLGKGDRLSEAHCDLIALVALDIKEIAYFVTNEVAMTVQLFGPGSEHVGRYGRTWLKTIDQYPLSDALKRMEN